MYKRQTQIARQRTANKARLLRLPNALCYDWEENLRRPAQQPTEISREQELQNVVAEFLQLRFRPNYQAIAGLEHENRPWYQGHIWQFWNRRDYHHLSPHYQDDFNLFDTPYPVLDNDGILQQVDPRSDLGVRGKSVLLPRFGEDAQVDLSDLCLDLSNYANSIGMVRPQHLKHGLIGHPQDVFDVLIGHVNTPGTVPWYKSLRRISPDNHVTSRALHDQLDNYLPNHASETVSYTHLTLPTNREV